MLSDILRAYAFLLLAVFFVDSESESVSVKEGDPVTLHTDIQAIQQETIKWYYDGKRIAEASLDYICTDVQCNEGTERFRGRLKLDNQTGSLTIKNTRITDSGDYIQEIIKTGDANEKTFSVTVYDAAERDEMMRNSTKGGEPDTPDQGSDLSAARITVTVVFLLTITLAAVAGCLHYHKSPARWKEMKACYNHDQVNVEGALSTEGKADPLLNEKDARREAEAPGDLRMESLLEKSALDLTLKQIE